MLDGANFRQGKIGCAVLALVLFIVGIGVLVRYLTDHYLGDKASSAGSVGLLNPGETSTESLLVPAITDTPTPTREPTPEPVVVYISGAVQQPDVYEVQPDARVIDVVNAAGGLTDEAAREHINLAAHVRDAQHIHVPRIDDENLPPMPADLDMQAPSTDTNADNSSQGSGEIVNLNTASAAELETLPGIGEVMAQRIIEYRTENGPFRAVEDLQNVQGIGSVLLANIRAYVRVE